jgi:hypothetical protein
MGDYADDALDQSLDEWQMAMEDPEDDEYWVGYSRRPRQRISIPSGPGPCPVCHSNVVLRTGKFGKFYGCSKFPKCRGTRKV